MKCARNKQKWLARDFDRLGHDDPDKRSDAWFLRIRCATSCCRLCAIPIISIHFAMRNSSADVVAAHVSLFTECVEGTNELGVFPHGEFQRLNNPIVMTVAARGILRPQCRVVLCGQILRRRGRTNLCSEDVPTCAEVAGSAEIIFLQLMA